MCDAEKHWAAGEDADDDQEGTLVLVCDITHDDEWHYDAGDDITWKEGRHYAG